MSTITNETSTTDTTPTPTDPTSGAALATANDETTLDGGTTSSPDVIVTREEKDRR